MRARRDAGLRAILREVTDPADPRLAKLATLLNATFPDPHTVLGLDRMQEFLQANLADVPAGTSSEERLVGRTSRQFRVLVVEHDATVVGGTIFSYVAKSNCGFSEYIVADTANRGRGLGRRLFNARKAVLDAEARSHGYAQCRGLFIEVDNPERTPSAFVEAERETALDTWQRLRMFAHLGFRRVDAPYVQPPLAPGKQAIDYLDLLFAPWASDTRRIPPEWVFDTVEAIWSAWTPNTFASHLATLRSAVSGPYVALLDPVSAAERGV
jgi:GNAT superfamily N-acetyltransferase